MDIVPIINAKTMPGFSTLHKLHRKKFTSSMACFFRTIFQNVMTFYDCSGPEKSN